MSRLPPETPAYANLLLALAVLAALTLAGLAMTLQGCASCEISIASDRETTVAGGTIL